MQKLSQISELKELNAFIKAPLNKEAIEMMTRTYFDMYNNAFHVVLSADVGRNNAEKIVNFMTQQLPRSMSHSRKVDNGNLDLTIPLTEENKDFFYALYVIGHTRESCDIFRQVSSLGTQRFNLKETISEHVNHDIEFRLTEEAADAYASIFTKFKINASISREKTNDSEDGKIQLLDEDAKLKFAEFHEICAQLVERKIGLN